MKRMSLLSLFLLMVVGCASFPPPTERLNTTEGAIRGATEVGAEQIPRAALHLKLAQEQTDKARQLMEDDDNELADQSLRRAQADAELAIALSHVAKSNVQAGAAVDAARAVRSGTPTP